MADEDYSPEQLSKLARHFVYVAPHGEVQDLLKDLRKVVDKSIITDEWVQSSLTEYNKRRFVIAEGDNSKVICCPQGEVEPNVYLHPDKKLTCKIDPVTQKITAESDAGNLIPSGHISEYRNEISNKLKEYLSSHYEDGTTNPNTTSRGFGTVYASPQGQIAIIVSYKNINLNNYWTGGWQSEWTFNVPDKGKGKAKLEGRIRLNVHYFEDGNVQLNTTFNENGDIDISDVKKTATTIINTIQTLENDFQQRLDRFYQQMHDSIFKNIRRALPKIGKKFDWRSSVHAVAAEAAGPQASS
jgi:capping protein alpha